MMKKTRSGNRSPKGARLGQHFLTNQHIARLVAESAGVTQGTHVLEIGPGTGALTKELLALGGTVTAIEKDPALVEKLQKTFATEIASGQLKLLEADVRDIIPETLFTEPYVLAANIPYYITGEIIRQFLSASHQPRHMALLMQKEVAQRIVARDGKESMLSLSVKVYGVPRIIKYVSAGSFNPPPSVDSAVLHVGNISRTFFENLDEQLFFALIRSGFSAKRKKVIGNLRAILPDAATILDSLGISRDIRAEDITLPQWHSLAEYLYRPGDGV